MTDDEITAELAKCEATIAETLDHRLPWMKKLAAALRELQTLQQRLAEAERERDGYSDQLEEVRKLFDGPPQFASRMALLEQIRTIVCRSPLCDTPLSLENESLRKRLAEQASVVEKSQRLLDVIRWWREGGYRIEGVREAETDLRAALAHWRQLPAPPEALPNKEPT